MPRDASGFYTLPSSNPVVSNTVIESAWANETMDDIAAQLNNVLTADGLLGFTGQALFIDGTAPAPGIAFKNQPSTGIYRNPSTGGINFSTLGAQTLGVNASGISVPGLGKKVFAEMTDSNIQNRFTFVTSQANKNTILQIAPNGTGDPAGAGAALLILSKQSDAANYYAMALGAGDVGTGIPRTAVRLFKVGTVPNVPLAIVNDDQVMMNFWEDSVITVGDHTPAPWGTGVAQSLKFFEIGKPGWTFGANTVAAPADYALGTVTNAYTDGTQWLLAANNPYAPGKVAAGLAVCRGDQFIFGFDGQGRQTAGQAIGWAPSVVVDWSTLNDNKLGVYGQVRAYQFVATATP